jgi:hypothetical protein
MSCFVLPQSRFLIFVFWQFAYNVSGNSNIKQNFFEFFFSTWSLLSILVFFIKFRRFSVNLSSNIISTLFSSWVFHWTYIDRVPQITEALFYFLIHLSFCPSDWIISVDLFSSLFIIYSSNLNLLLSLCSENFHFSYFNFSIPELLIFKKNNFYLPISIFLFGETLLLYFSLML